MGQTPQLRHRYRRERISTISSLTVSPGSQRLGLYVAFHARNISGEQIVAFLRQLLRQLRGPVVLLWDGIPTHRRRLVRAFLRQHLRLHVYQFPGYAPELNPDEWVWQQAKHALSNSRPRDLPELDRRLRDALRRIKHSQRLLWSCIFASELPWRR